MVNVGPRGTILGAQVRECTNVSACAGIAMPGGAILGEEVGGGTVVCACTGTMGPGSVIPGVDSMVGGGGRVRSGGGIGFHVLPQSLSSGVWVIMNMMVLALNNADTLCHEPGVLGGMCTFSQLLDGAHLFSSLCL
jgi:hypothetical protein